MSSHKHRSDPNRRRSKTVHSLASDGSTVNSAAPSYPSTPGGGTSSTGLTSPSDTPTDFDQTQLPNQQHPALLGAEAFGSYYQAPFGDPQMYPSQDGYAQLGQDHAQYWQSTVAQGTHVPPGQDQETHGSSSGQDVYAQLDQYHEYYGQSSSGQDVYSSPGQDQGYQAQGSAETEAEAEAYASPGSSDDMATSMVVSPGSPPSPSKVQYPSGASGKKSKGDTTKDKTKGNCREKPMIIPWRPHPENTSRGHGRMMGGDNTYGSEACLGFTTDGFHAASLYPTSIPEADLYGYGEPASPSHQNNQHYQHQHYQYQQGEYQQGEEGWDMCDR